MRVLEMEREMRIGGVEVTTIVILWPCWVILSPMLVALVVTMYWGWSLVK